MVAVASAPTGRRLLVKKVPPPLAATNGSMEEAPTAMPPHTAVPAAPVPAFGMLPEQLLALIFSYADAPETGQAAASCHALRAAALHAMPGGYSASVCIDHGSNPSEANPKRSQTPHPSPPPM